MMNVIPWRQTGGCFLALALLLTADGCSMQKLAVRATGGLLDAGFESLMAEGDLQLARSATESDLKLLEGLLLADPGNEDLMILAAQGFISYSLAFAEDVDPDRAVRLYLRGRDYAARWIRHRYEVDLLGITNVAEFENTVRALPSSSVPGVFWMGNGWASAILLSLDNVEMVTDLARAERLMQFVLENDETYYYGGAHLFYTGYYGSRPRMLGGDPDKARYHSDRQRELTNSNFLLAVIFEVRFVHLPALDKDAAVKALRYVMNYDLDDAPQIRLPNRVAKEKAKVLFDHLDDYL